MSAIHQKLHAVMKDVDYIQKTGQNRFHGYKYVSEKDVKSAVHKACVDHGIVPQFNFSDIQQIEWAPTAKGKPQWLTTLKMSYSFSDTETGESLSGESVACGIDGEDKGVYKAMTQGIKYVLTSQFLIPTGEDAEAPNDYEKDGGIQDAPVMQPEAPSAPPEVRKPSLTPNPTKEDAKKAFKDLFLHLGLDDMKPLAAWFSSKLGDDIGKVSESDPVAVIRIAQVNWDVDQDLLKGEIDNNWRNVKEAERVAREIDNQPKTVPSQLHNPTPNPSSTAAKKNRPNLEQMEPIAIIGLLTGMLDPIQLQSLMDQAKSSFGDMTQLNGNEKARNWLISVYDMDPEERAKLLATQQAA